MGTTLKPRTSEVVLFQGDDYEQFHALRAAVEAAAASNGPRRLGDNTAVTEAAAAFDAFVADAAERGVTVGLKAVPRKAWREFVAKNPPREDDEVDAAWGFNYETMADDLVPASVLDPTAHGEAFLDALSDAEFSALYTAAVQLNQGGMPDPKAPLSSRFARTSGETSTAPQRLA